MTDECDEFQVLEDDLRIFGDMVERATKEGLGGIRTATDREQRAVDGVFTAIPALLKLVQVKRRAVIAVVRLEDGRYAVEQMANVSGLSRDDIAAMTEAFRTWGQIHWDLRP